MVLQYSVEDESWRRGSSIGGMYPWFVANGAKRCSGFRGRYKVVIFPYRGIKI